MFTRNVLAIDAEAAAERIEQIIRSQVLGTLRRKGVVVALSGGIDSSVVAALAVRALGAHRVLGLLMPEQDTSAESMALARTLARTLSIETLTEDIGPALEALGCFRRQVEAIRTAIPGYGEGWRCKLSLPPLHEESRLNVSILTAEAPDGTRRTARLSASAYLQLIAATNFKQRVRATLAYYHADRRHFAVAGTPNRLEYDQGFFVKHGDGAADLKPIAHLYKTQVYALAGHLGIPEEIHRRPPTTETFSLPQTQEEFFFALPYDQLDLCLYALNHHVPSEEVASALGFSSEHVERVFRDIEGKRRATRYLHTPPLLIDTTEDL